MAGEDEAVGTGSCSSPEGRGGGKARDWVQPILQKGKLRSKRRASWTMTSSTEASPGQPRPGHWEDQGKRLPSQAPSTLIRGYSASRVQV